MKYNTLEFKNETNTIIDGENNLHKVKDTIISLLDLNEVEKNSISKIKNNKDLLNLVKFPGEYLTDSNVKAFNEITELLDLLGGIYYA